MPPHETSAAIIPTWLDWDSASFYLVSFVISAAAAGCFAALSNDGNKSWRVRVASMGISGFLGFVVIGLLLGRGGTITGHWYWFAISALIGLAGSHQEQLIEMLLKKFGLTSDDKKDEQ